MTEIEIRREIKKIKSNCIFKWSNDRTENLKQLENWTTLASLYKKIIDTGKSSFEDKSDYISCKDIIKRISEHEDISQ